MNHDIRIRTDFLTHPRRLRLEKAAGRLAVQGLIDLWLWVALHRPDGKLDDLDKCDLQAAVRWDDDADLVEALIAAGFLEQQNGTYRLRDWKQNQPYVTNARARSRAAKVAAQARWNKRDNARRIETALRPAYATRNATRNAECNAPTPTPTPKTRPTYAVSENSGTSETKVKSGECREPKFRPPPPPGTISIECIGGETKHVMPGQLREWGQLFPAVNVPLEVRKAKAWLEANPTKRKTLRGCKRFLFNWLSRTQDRGGSSPVMAPGGSESDERNRLLPEDPDEARRVLDQVRAASEELG